MTLKVPGLGHCLSSALVAFFLVPTLSAQPELQRRVAAIAAEAKGSVSVACLLPGTDLNCDLNPHAHPPMQSVFKLPLAAATLEMVERGRMSLNDEIRFRASDRILPRAYSPLQDRYPNAELDIPLRQLLENAVSLSDNVAADIILRTIGGPAVVDRYMRSLGIDGFHLEDNEATLHATSDTQYRNWFEPSAAVRFLRLLNDGLPNKGSPLTPEHTKMLLDWMRDTPRANQRIRGRLPSSAVVMHKPGTSGTFNGLTAATNDIGLIVLPDGRRLAIAVFVTDSRADDATRDSVIARIAEAVYSLAVQ